MQEFIIRRSKVSVEDILDDDEGKEEADQESGAHEITEINLEVSIFLGTCTTL